VNVAIVTSLVTYMPENYLPLLAHCLESKAADNIKALILLDNLDYKTISAAPGLIAMGAKKMGTQLLRNILELPLGRREKYFKSRGLEVVRFKSMNDLAAVEWVRAKKIDLIVNARTRCIYKKKILTTPTYGCINIHHGLLPNYRGTLCDLHALANNRPAGFSIHRMNEKIDDGEIFHVEEVSTDKERNYHAYLEKTMKREAIALEKIIHFLKTNTQLPTGIANKTANPVFSKNPTSKEIRELKKRGFSL
jgi:methionyl-tRNA formyltransferase